jgi:hypothetical protein
LDIDVKQGTTVLQRFYLTDNGYEHGVRLVFSFDLFGMLICFGFWMHALHLLSRQGLQAVHKPEMNQRIFLL